MDKKIIILALSVISLLFNREVHSYSLNVHEEITKRVINQNKTILNTYFTNIGLTNGVDEELKSGNDTKEVRKWIEEGSWKEDFNWSWSWNNNPLYSHFYNPLTNDSGVGAWPSAYHWANATNNDWSWIKARDYFYQGLTLGTKLHGGYDA